MSSVRISRFLALATLVLLVAGCTSDGTATEPPTTSAPSDVIEDSPDPPLEATDTPDEESAQVTADAISTSRPLCFAIR